MVTTLGYGRCISTQIQYVKDVVFHPLAANKKRRKRNRSYTEFHWRRHIRFWLPVILVALPSCFELGEPFASANANNVFRSCF